VKQLYNYNAIVREVYDGDTVTVDLDLGFHIHLKDIKLRLLGIDAPEVRGAERKKGVIVRDKLRARILHQEVVVWTIEKDSFGRWLAVIYDEGECVNSWLLRLDEVKRYK